MRSSLTTLFAASVGAGLLALPKMFAKFGLAFGVALIFIFIFLSYLAKYILNELIIESGKKSYANLVAHYLGSVTIIETRNQGSSLLSS